MHGGERVARDRAGAQVGNEGIEMREDLRGEAVKAVAGVELAGQVGDVVGGEDGDVAQLGVGGHGGSDLGGSEIAAEDEELERVSGSSVSRYHSGRTTPPRRISSVALRGTAGGRPSRQGMWACSCGEDRLGRPLCSMDECSPPAWRSRGSLSLYYGTVDPRWHSLWRLWCIWRSIFLLERVRRVYGGR